MARPAYARIDLDALRHNYRLARQLHGGRALAVLKANAYGHGAVACAQALAGLADGYGDVDQIARDKIKAPDIVDYTLQENVAERLAKRFGASLGMGAVRELSNLGGTLR